MPYTPPTHRSPASSASASPDVSRRSSFQSGNRPSLPRSASYLAKHRRTPSVSAISDASTSPLTPQATEEDLPAMAASASASGPAATPAPTASVRQSPPPLTDDRGMPKGAVISPPDSASSGSDDEGPEIRGRNSDRLRDLRDAVSQIPQPRTPSPTAEATQNEPRREPTPSGMRISFSTSALGDLPKAGSKGPRKISHIRSATEPNASAVKSADCSLSASEEDTDEDLRTKPQMVRKKSGELVRPALRPSSRRRPSSMPGTPIFSKAVHFDSHLEHVRHFLQVDRPLAVSAGSSPVDNYDSDNEYPFPGEERTGTRSPPYEWDIITSNFPHDTPARKTLPVKLEKVWLSTDQKSMLGSIAVANLAFSKSVLCRFTLDYWKTTSEVVAEYSHEIRPRETPLGYDRFTFNIKLADTANLESKTLFFCVRYSVNGQEYWDNNSQANFQVDFRKKHLPMNGKNNFQGAASRPLNGLPRSNRRQNPSSALRPKSMPVAFDDFGDDKFSFDQPIHEYLGESGTTGLRLKTKSTGNLGSDNIGNGLSSPSGVAFANRYDFGASLSAAVQAAKDTMGKDKDALYMKKQLRGMPPALTVSPKESPALVAVKSGTDTNSPTQGLPSSSYEELVNKYCFFGSKQTSPTMQDGTKEETLKDGRFDGTGGGDEASTGSTNSLSSSPLIGRATGSAASHSIHLHDSSPHLHHVSWGASPISSPPRKHSPARDGSQSSTPKAAGSLRSTSPGCGPVATPPGESSYHAQQRALHERFPWAGDAHAATAIRG